MIRLFTALEVPSSVSLRLQMLQAGLRGLWSWRDWVSSAMPNHTRSGQVSNRAPPSLHCKPGRKQSCSASG